MNNEQFRKLIQSNAAKTDSNKRNGATTSPSAGKAAAAPALGSKQRASIPMTPRSVAGSSISAKSLFAKQLAERDQADQPQKRLRISAPKGSKLAQGYIDRARTRHDEEEDERAARLKALEESYKNEEIDRATYDMLRGQIAGGDLSSTHLVKGLDFKLLQKVRRGEDVFGDKKETPARAAEPDDQGAPTDGAAAGDGAEADDELEKLEATEVQAIAKEKALKKKGQLSTVALAPGKKRTRDQILAELRAAREAAKAKQESQLGTRFKKIGEKKTPGTRIERDSKGREVMIIVDEDGHEKRKVRKVAGYANEKDAFIPAKNSEVLGMEVPEFYRKKQKELEEQQANAEVNIFDDADDYDPLAGLASDSDDESSSDDGSEAEKAGGKSEASRDGSARDNSASPPSDEGQVSGGEEISKTKRPASSPEVTPAQVARNYFKDSKTGLVSQESRTTAAADDPAVLAALRKAKALNIEAKTEEEKKNAEREERLKKMLRESNRDVDDLDMGFGTNRLADEEDMEEKDVKLAKWGDEEDGEDGGGGGKSKRKRGPKKRKGDINSAADVLKVLERRKAADS